MTDAFMELITRYQRVEAEYNAHPIEDAAGCKVKEDAHTAMLDEVGETTLRATSINTVEAAIRQAIKECNESCPGLAAALLRGALGFFDVEAAREDAR
ncbi:hypothetical protein C8J35_103498 [Rhizobium sp. PP-F2F-G38]|nr:hypothetical protein C8J35_103498 [Rhizobium sp. PP-F2F-G38]